MLTRTQLGLLCVAVLCVTLSLGLWPFHAPRNAVTWLAGENGVRFGDAGAILSERDLPPAAPGESGCTVEALIQPARQWDSSELLAFYTPGKPVSLGLRQSDSDLLLQLGAMPGPHRAQGGQWYVNEVFLAPRRVFLTVSSGAQGTQVYLDGKPARASRRFRVTAADCAGRLVLGTSPINNDRWQGNLRGLAIYRRELEASQVTRHYQTWSQNGRPALESGESCIALYLFDERSGRQVRNQMAPGTGLLIPERYQIQDQVFLMPFWDEFAPSGGYAKGLLKNIVGLIPLGFCLYAWFAARVSARKAAWIATLMGTLVSMTIEVSQAYLPTRDSGTTDLFTNTFGAWLGVLLYRYVERRGFRLGARR
jgi:hypothetical protein